jgi:hypothetical protein
MTNQIKAALAAALITFSGLTLLACAPEAPPAVEAPTDPVDVPGPCANGATPENPDCQVP